MTANSTGSSTGPRPPQFPFRRPFAVDGLPARGTPVVLTASAEEMAALAADLDILGLEALKAELVVAPWRASGVKITGTVRARATQACVVTLDPVAQEIDETVDVRMLPAAEIEPQDDDEIEIDAEAADPPEPFDGTSIDLGHLVAEHVALGLDPYPRAPGASFEPRIEDDGAEPERPHPFAGLAALKRGDDER